MKVSKKLIALLLTALMLLSAVPIMASAASVNDLYYEIVNGKVTITACKDYASGELSIPSKIEGYSVTSIGDWAFERCEKLTNISIPDSVTVIGEHAFDSCLSLESITIPDSVTDIGEGAFESCKKLKGITIPNSITTISFMTFAYCDSLTYVIIPEGITNIENFAFDCCYSLEKIAIPSTVKSIGEEFSGCKNLKSITVDKNNPIYDSRNNCNAVIETATNTLLFGCQNTKIPDSIKIIGSAAFEGCENLENITIPSGVTTISNFAFAYCTGLTGITISDSVSNIDYCAFTYCNSLTDVYYNGTKKQWNNIEIDEAENENLLNATIHFADEPVTSIYNLGEETYSFTNFSDSDAGGHCFGMSMTSSGYYLGCLNVSQTGIDDCQKLYTLSKTQKVKAPICEYQNKQGCSNQAIVAGGSKYLKHINNITRDWDEVINYVKNHEYDNKGLLQVAFRKGDEGHAVNFLRYEVVDGQERIYVYDNNFPNSETYLYKATPSDIREASPYQTFSGSLDTVALRDVTKYFRAVESYDETRYISANESEIKIVFAEKVYIDGGNESADVIYKLPEDDTEVVVIPLIDNAEFEYLDKTYSFGKIDEETVGIFKLSELSGNTVTGKPSLKITERPDVDISVYADDIVMDYAMNARVRPIIEITEGVKYSIEYYSSNPNKIDVEEDGSIVAHKRGKELIYITVTDEYGHEAKDVLNVKVKFTIFQWFIWIFLLGFLWY